MHVLVIERDPKTALDLKNLLLKRGYTCGVVHTGRLAQSKAKHYHSDCIVLNPDLPDMKASELLEYFKVIEVDAVVVIWGSSRDKVLLQHGGVAHVNRAGGLRKLIARIAVLMRQRQRRIAA